MKIKTKHIFTFLMLFLIIFAISTQNNVKNGIETAQEDLKDRPYDLKQAGFWNNFTFIHITNLNWTVANETDWCSGSGTWGEPYLIENMVINASDSPIGCGIFIENSVNVYFTIRNVTIFETTNGIKLENTNKGALINNRLLDNIDSGISLVNCVNNTISRNELINNRGNGINLTSNCINNKILGNTAKNDGTNFQVTGIYLGDSCNNNEIMENLVSDNNINGIFIEDYCEENVIYNNTVKNTVTNQQDFGIRLYNNCDQNNISLNVIKDLNSFGIYLVTSDGTSISNNQIIDISNGMWMLIAHQSEITSNTISGGSTAISMSACDGGEIIGNFINNTGNYGIRIIINCDDNEFHDNIIKDNNNVGIQLDDPSDINNIFYKNSFISNGIHAYDNGTTTSWNNTMIGNYWDNYSGVDLNWDNIGDTPFIIPGGANSSDNLPIVNHWAPTIKINTPTSSVYGTNAPEFNINVNETYIYSMWYTINSGIKYYITENGTIDQDTWNALDDGNVIITFYARDIAWNLNLDSVTVNKDTINPIVSITSPTGGESFGAIAPDFVLEIRDSGSSIDTMWYTINNSGTKYYFTENDTVNQVSWNALNDGDLIITFYTQDIALNIGSISLNLTKDTSLIPDGGTPSPDVIIIIVVSVIVISVIAIAGILMKKLSAKEKIKKSRKLNEEELSKAQYVKDISSILTILAIHNESGLCLSKIAVHAGIGLDEHLFTGFISAMGSFKDELAKQMGLPVRGEGGDNVIEYNEFTITLMDGEYLRLGLVSYKSLGNLIKEQCGQILRAYEIKHVNDLKNFEGEIQVFNDFEETIETGLDMNLNKKSIINVKQLNKYDAPESFITILNDLNSKSDGFYPAEIALTLVREMNISDQEANFMVYEAYKNQIFLPI